MAIDKSTVITFFTALAIGAGLIFFAAKLMPPQQGAAYAVVTVDALYPDREITRRLDGGGISGYESESTQIVYYDDFGELRSVSLDGYESRIESFDPRNDGYAEKLRSLFVTSGGRHVYIPAGGNTSGGRSAPLLKKIDAALGDIPYSAEIIGYTRPVMVPCILFLAAFAASLYYSTKRAVLVYTAPSLTAFSLYGIPGFAAAALLFMIFSILCDPLGEYFLSLRYNRVVRGKIFLSRPQGIILGLLVIGFSALVFTGGISPLFCLAAVPLSAVVFIAALRNSASQGKAVNHIRFVPVPIRPSSRNLGYIHRSLLPFALGALAGFFFFFASGEPAAYSGVHDGLPVTKTDFEKHIAYQTAFSLVSLEHQEPGYGSYFLGPDGLIQGQTGLGSGLQDTSGIDFSLEGILGMLQGGENGKFTADYVPGDVLSIIILLALSMPFMFFKAREGVIKRRMNLYNDKRIAA
ncbi:hypothetical protein [Breznakiella homolactica]|uniref:Uncharacterized protein n=1 Tax=Breznakiella homolactica TaxID=2798577 RepID=A0A7T7XKN4_9SPIR|nr:hypothetical protein [Breznakiella homolactica]QQO07948.1 hypothetical protein JFL75_13480 [Breznakiella homolactica]